MKHILLSLVFLSWIPLLSKDAAANPTATVGNSASAAAVPESDVKRLDAEADVKGDAQHEHAYEQLIDVVYPELLKRIARKNELDDEAIDHAQAAIVLDYLIPKQERWKTIEWRVAQAYNNFMWEVGKIAAPPLPEARREVSKVVIPYTMQAHGMRFPKELVWLIAEYAQHDLRPIEAVFKDVMQSEAMVTLGQQLKTFINEDAVIYSSPRCQEYRTLLDNQGVVFPHSRETRGIWAALGFSFMPQVYETPVLDGDRVICQTCGFRPAWSRGRLINPAHNYGDVSGLGMEWRAPWAYHHRECKMREIMKNKEAFKKHFKKYHEQKGLSEEDKEKLYQECQELTADQVYGSNVPSYTNETRKFEWHIMLHLDLYARECSQNKSAPEKSRALAKLWLNRLKLLGYFMTLAPNKYDYMEDPEGWIEDQNTHAAELGSSVRYELPQNPATK